MIEPFNLPLPPVALEKFVLRQQAATSTPARLPRPLMTGDSFDPIAAAERVARQKAVDLLLGQQGAAPWGGFRPNPCREYNDRHIGSSEWG